jgi:hypothetical protein
MDRLKTITIIGIIFGAILFLGFYISNVLNYNIIGIPSLRNFIAMIGILVFIISGFFYFSLKTINQ